MSDTQLWTPSNSYEAIFYADGYFPEWQMSSAGCCVISFSSPEAKGTETASAWQKGGKAVQD